MAANLAAFSQLWDVNPTFAPHVLCTTQLSHARHVSPAHSKLRGQQTWPRTDENVFRFRGPKSPDSRGRSDHTLPGKKALLASGISLPGAETATRVVTLGKRRQAVNTLLISRRDATVPFQREGDRPDDPATPIRAEHRGAGAAQSRVAGSRDGRR